LYYKNAVTKVERKVLMKKEGKRSGQIFKGEKASDLVKTLYSG